MDTQKNSRQRKDACGLFVDFQKAFNMVNHNILIDKLDQFGIRGPLNNWVVTYLNNKQQYDGQHDSQRGSPEIVYETAGGKI